MNACDQCDQAGNQGGGGLRYMEKKPNRYELFPIPNTTHHTPHTTHPHTHTPTHPHLTHAHTHTDKVMRPVVKPNQGSASADAAEPLPIHIDVLPDCMVQVTTSSVFDVHLVDHLAQPDQYMVNDNFAVLGRMVAIVHEEIDFCQSPPVHRRRLNLSLMELEASSAVRQ